MIFDVLLFNFNERFLTVNFSNLKNASKLFVDGIFFKFNEWLKTVFDVIFKFNKR